LFLSSQPDICVYIQIGHTSHLREKPTQEGFLYDWTLFVRGENSQDISQFVQKVVFHLHSSFPDPQRGESFRLFPFPVRWLTHQVVLMVRVCFFFFLSSAFVSNSCQQAAVSGRRAWVRVV
jgi:hypothetical protein